MRPALFLSSLLSAKTARVRACKTDLLCFSPIESCGLDSFCLSPPPFETGRVRYYTVLTHWHSLFEFGVSGIWLQVHWWGDPCLDFWLCACGWGGAYPPCCLVWWVWQVELEVDMDYGVLMLLLLLWLKCQGRNAILDTDTDTDTDRWFFSMCMAFVYACGCRRGCSCARARAHSHTLSSIPSYLPPTRYTLTLYIA